MGAKRHSGNGSDTQVLARRHQKIGSDQRGAVLVTTALVLVMLLVFAAFVVDIGATYLERRQDQAAADAAVLAGGSLLLQPALIGDINLIAQDAVEIARLNISMPPDEAAWNAMFAACQDLDRDFSIYPGGDIYKPRLSDNTQTDCVHFNTSATQIRVRLPDQFVPTTFAKVIGVNALSTYAVAEARIVPTGQRAIPFALATDQGNPQDLLCIRLDTGCSGPGNQNPRVLDSPHYGNPGVGTTMACGTAKNGNANPGSDVPPFKLYPTFGDRAANNAAVGLDHVLFIHDPGPPSDPVRADDCGPSSNAPQPLPNHVYAMEIDNLVSGTPAAAEDFFRGIAEGLIFGRADLNPYSDGDGPRLSRYPGGVGWSTRTLTRNAQQYVVDDRPLWDFIDPANTTGIPTSCYRSGFNSTPAANTLRMVTCLNTWDPSDGVLFDSITTTTGKYDIELSGRVGMMPEISGPGPNSANYPPSPVSDFVIGFIHSIFFSNYSLGCSPCVEYIPGAGGGPIDVDGQYMVGMNAFRIIDGMLPLSAQPNAPGTLGGQVSLIR